MLSGQKTSSLVGKVCAKHFPFLVRDIKSYTSHEVLMWNALTKLCPKIISCDNWSEQRKQNVNFTLLILSVVSHSSLLLMKVPLSALILMLLGNISVLYFAWVLLEVKRQSTFTST